VWAYAKNYAARNHKASASIKSLLALIERGFNGDPSLHGTIDNLRSDVSIARGSSRENKGQKRKREEDDYTDNDAEEEDDSASLEEEDDAIDDEELADAMALAAVMQISKIHFRQRWA